MLLIFKGTGYQINLIRCALCNKNIKQIPGKADYVKNIKVM